MDALQHQLHRMLFTFWRLPDREGRVFLRALLRSDCSRVVELRHQLTLLQAVYPTYQGWREVDGAHVFGATLTPAFLVAMLHDLQSAGELTREQRRVIEKAVLHTVSSTGAWKAVEE